MKIEKGLIKTEQKPSLFRRFVAISQGFFGIIIIFVIIAPYLYLGFFNVSAPKLFQYIFNGYFREAGNINTDIYYRIGNNQYSKKYLNNLYKTVLDFGYGPHGAKRHLAGKAERQAFLRDSLGTDLLVKKALDQGLLNDPECSLLLTNALRHTLSEYYVYKMVTNEFRDFEMPVKKPEILQFYQKHKKTYQKKKIPQEAALKSIQQNLNEMRKQEAFSFIRQQRKNYIKKLKNIMKVDISSNEDFGY